ncbi:MAG: WG repeat-containing protein [Akkermansia sp.]|nr:WG repeat-containing protein [Akkermansia sp.]
MDSDGNEVVPFLYDFINLPAHYSHGCAAVGCGSL